MKSTFHSAGPLVRSFCGLSLVALALLLAGCGQRGPLYIGKPPPERSTAGASATTSATTPVPESTPLKSDDPAISLPASK